MSLVTSLRVVVTATTIALASSAAADGPPIKLVPNEAERRVEVLIEGQPFTAYIYPKSQMKPLLWPIRTAKGTAITRGFPLTPQPDEPTDHPHHLGLWMNHGNVEGVDFWNHSEAMSADKRARAGTIVHRGVRKAAGGVGRGTLAVASDWVMPDGKVAIKEETTFTFHAAPGVRAIDRVAVLTAADKDVRLTDNKEGVLGLRLARALQQPGKKEEPGKSTGLYTSSEGKTGDAVWGTRARWVMLTGALGEEKVTVAILDHPKNPGHPTYWHARGYGLFAANPFGERVFTKGAKAFDYLLPKGKPTRLAYRVVIMSKTATAADVEAAWKTFVAEVK